MAALTNKAIAGVFRRIETLLRVLGEEERRAVSYGRAARLIEGLAEPAADLAAAGKLLSVRGIGPKIQAAVAGLVDRGSCDLLDELAARLPPGVFEILAVPGLGPKRVHSVLHDLEVRSLDGLRAAAEDGRLAALKGFGPRTVARILEGIAFVSRTRGRKRAADAWAMANKLIESLDLREAVIAGALRRGEPVVDRIVIVALGDPEKAPMEGMVLVNGGWERPRGAEPALRVRCARPAMLARALFEETGPKEHVETVLARPGSAADENEIYTSRGLHRVPPERRHAEDGSRPVSRLLSRKDLRGLIHCHTTWSDGALDLEAMAAAAAERGYEYLAISDHSRVAVYAGGLSIERLQTQRNAIDAINALGGPVRLLHGSEVDILPDGRLDYPDEVLASLDFVIASVHSSFGRDREAMTARIVRAVRHPQVNILGHPTGRLLLRREGYAVDLEAVLAAAAEAGTAVELNANPWRIDLDPAWHARAMELGIGVPVAPDAHSAEGLDDVRWGVLAARRGGLGPDQVPNTRDADGFLERLLR